MAKDVSPQKRRLTPALIVLILILLGLVLVFFILPRAAEPTSKAGGRAESVIRQSGDSQGSAGKTSAFSGHRSPQKKIFPERPSVGMERAVRSGPPRRNPFQPPAGFFQENASARERGRIQAGPDSSLPGSKGVAGSERGGLEVETAGLRVKPRFKGIVGNPREKLALIESGNRTYILQEGDYLPGSDYQLIQVDSRGVILRSAEEWVNLEGRREE